MLLSICISIILSAVYLGVGLHYYSKLSKFLFSAILKKIAIFSAIRICSITLISIVIYKLDVVYTIPFFIALFASFFIVKIIEAIYLNKKLKTHDSIQLNHTVQN